MLGKRHLPLVQKLKVNLTAKFKSMLLEVDKTDLPLVHKLKVDLAAHFKSMLLEVDKSNLLLESLYAKVEEVVQMRKT